MSTNPEMKVKLVNKVSYKANFFVQFAWLLWRTFLSTLRDAYSTQISFAQTIVRVINK